MEKFLLLFIHPPESNQAILTSSISKIISKLLVVYRLTFSWHFEND